MRMCVNKEEKMKIYTHITLADDNRHYVINSEYHREKNRQALEELLNNGAEADEIRIINLIPEDDYCEELVIGSEEGMKTSLMCIARDMLDENSAIREWMSKQTGKDVSGVFLEIMEAFIDYRARNLIDNNIKTVDYDVFYGQSGIDELEVLSGCKAPYFRIHLPKDIVREHYDDDDKTFFDLKLLSDEDLIKLVIPAYYDDLGMWDREYLRKDKAKIQFLTRNWLNTLFAALA